MLRLSSRLVCFGGSSVHLEYTEGRAAEIVGFLFRGVPDDQWIDPHVNVRLRERPDATFEILCAGESRFTHGSPSLVARELLDIVCEYLAGGSRSGMVLHAASVAWQGAGVLMPGRSGAGKTTLAGYLTTRGFRYLSDELTYVEDGSTHITAMTRPLKIKTPAGVNALEGHLSIEDGEREALVTDVDMLVAEVAPALESPPSASLSAIVFPHYARGATFRLDEVTKARTGLRLMECLLNARNLAGHGFEEASRIARTVPAYAMTFSDLEQVGASLDVLTSRLEPPSGTPSASPASS